MDEEPAVKFGLDFTYDGADSASLIGVEGTVRKGRCIVLCGGSGSGKSTLLRAMDRLIPEFYEGKLTGFMSLAGRDSEELSIGEAGKLASSVFQDPRSQFFTLSSSTEIAFGLENFGFPHAEIVRRVDEAFSSSGLGRLRDRDVFELSSGERQLVAILAANAVDTDIMLLDEPTANLDHAAIESLRKLLMSLKEKGKTLILSEHRLYYLSGLADEYWIMDKGEIIEKLGMEEMLSLTEEELRKRGLRTTDISRIVNRTGKGVETEETHVFRAEDAVFSYRGTGRILDGLTLEARTGEVIGLVGPNGSGKTTFGKLASGLLRKGGGSFTLDGEVLKRKDLSRNAIFIMQEAEFQFFSNSVLNELDWKDSPKERKAEIRELLTDLDMWQTRNRHPFSLSGGQMQKLVLLMAYLSPKPVAVLDEPTAGLDRRSLEAVSALIDRMARTKAVFVITHDAELLALSCTKACSLGRGKVTGEHDLTTDEGFREICGFLENGLVPEERAEKKRREERMRLDPRTRFLIALTAMVVGLFTDMRLMCFTMAAVAAAALLERQWGIVIGTVLPMLLLHVLSVLFPGVAMSFVVSFFPRIILLGAGAALICRKSEAARSLAAMRRMHVPEGVIAVLSVVMRFFPVLRKDLGMMNQSIRTRGFFPRFRDRIRAIPKCAEILIVPMVFRVIRIAEALSASAETRGIALKGRRESWIGLEFGPADLIVSSLTVLLVVLGILI